MLSLFPQRTRRDLKLKFKKEEKLNASLINKALLNPKAFNIEELEKELAHDEEVLRQKQEALKKINEAKLVRKKKYILLKIQIFLKLLNPIILCLVDTVLQLGV